MDKQTFEDKYMKQNIAVICKTNEESKEFLKYAYEFGFISQEIIPRNDWFEDGLVAYCLNDAIYEYSKFSFDYPDVYIEESDYTVVEFSNIPIVTMEDVYEKFGGAVIIKK